MHKYFLILFTICFATAQAQEQPIPLFKTITLSDAPDDFEPLLMSLYPTATTGGDYIQNKKLVDGKKSNHQTIINSYKTDIVGPAPTLLNSWAANITNGTPADNSMAISNGGKVVSVCNTNIRIYNDTGGKFLYSKTLGAFASSVGTLVRYYDPKAIYDVNNDRFIVTFLEGTSSKDTWIILCFSQTNDPAGKWNCYKLPGNKEKDTTWTDYPILGISKEDVFVTVNKLHDNMGWKDGFVKSIIWQVPMSKGYAGDSLTYIYHNQNIFGGKPLWSICPVQGGILPTHPFMHFLTVRPADIGNDSVFLHTIDNTVSSGIAKWSARLLKTDKIYGVPATAKQPGGQWLQTNDCRVLGAIYENGNIQYVQTNNDTNTYLSTIYHGYFDAKNSQTIKGNWVAHDSFELAYPNICYSGQGPGDHGAVVTCSYVNKNTFPGTCAFYVNRDLDGYSPLVICKNGDKYVDVLPDTAERWGDYTGVQRRYNKPGECWMSGSFGDVNFTPRTTIAAIKTNDPKLGVPHPPRRTKPLQTLAYPNPANENYILEFEMPQSEMLAFYIYDITGKNVLMPFKDKAGKGANRFSFNTSSLAVGNYYISIVSSTGEILRSEKFVVVK